MATVFYAYRDSPQRRTALQTPVGSPEPAASEAPPVPVPCEITPGIVLDSLIQNYGVLVVDIEGGAIGGLPDRKSTRLNSSH